MLWYAMEFCGSLRLELAGDPQGESELEKMKEDMGMILLVSVYEQDGDDLEQLNMYL